MKDQKRGKGRPKLYEDTPENYELICQKVQDYFNNIDKKNKPPTVTGLTLALGFCHKSSLYDYAKNPYFSDPIKQGLTRIEMFHEEKTAFGDKCTGNIFVLKNFGWADSQDIKITETKEVFRIGDQEFEI